MDYDDNEFHGQNPHLGGEGNSKFSPVLHPYSLPKFDFDDGLPGHLRFDSLVENEVFLGIPSQEDNQWIEDFSRGSSGIVFSSSAPESCPILRHNNVWSEATSSESVEMLLKSVGQEDTVSRQTVVEESDDCHKFDSVTEQMESHMKEDNKVQDAMDSGLELPSENVEDHVSNMNDVESVSNIVGVEILTRGRSHVLSSNGSSETCGVFGTENDIDSRHSKEDHIEVNIPLNGSPVNRVQNNPAGSFMQFEDIDTQQDIIASAGGFTNEKSENREIDVGFENANCLLTDSVNAVQELNVMRKDVLVGDQLLKGDAFESGNKNLKNLPSSSEMKLYQTTQGAKSSEGGIDPLQGSNHQLANEASVGNNQAPLLSNVDNKVFEHQGDGSCSSYVGEHSIVTATCTSTQIQSEQHSAEKLKYSDDASGAEKVDIGAEDHVSFPIISAVVLNPDSTHDGKDVSYNGKEKPLFPSDSNEMKCEIVDSISCEKRVELSSKGEIIKVKNVVICGFECDGAARIEPEDTVDAVPLLSGTAASEDQVVDHTSENPKTENEGSIETSLMSLKETSQSTSKIGAILGLKKGSSYSSAQEMSLVAVDQSLPAAETLTTASGSEQSGEVMHKTACQPFLVAGNSSTPSQSGHEKEEHQIVENFSSKLEACSTICDRTTKHCSLAEEIDFPASHEVVGKHHKLASSEVADSNEPKGGTPTVSNCTVLCQGKNDTEETVKESMDKGVPLAQSVQSTSQELTDVSKDDKSFTFEVHLSAGIAGESGKEGQFSPPMQVSKSSKEGSPLTPTIGQMDHKTVSEISHGSSQALDREFSLGGSKVTAERKRGRPSGKATGKPNAKKGKPLKETTPSRQLERSTSSYNMSVNLSGTGQLVQFEGLKPHEKFEHSNTVTTAPSGGVSIATSNLPDLNTSAPTSPLFQQPFTDLQQVQLRAQIFVYGSLIQGAAPDEACMVSAFGTSDGGRSLWEPVWCACVERLQGPKSNLNKCENPVQPRSGANPPEQSTKKDALQSSVLPSPAGRASSKGTPSPVINSMIPLSSPLWNISTPCHGLQSSGMPRSGLIDYRQTLSPLQSFQTPPTRNFGGNNPSWLSQASFPAPWIAASQTSPYDASVRLPALPMTETVKLTPVKESVPPVSSGAKHASPSTTVPYTGPSALAEASPLPDAKKTTLSSGQKSAEPKSRKRKKSTALETPILAPLPGQIWTESVSVPVVSSHLSTSIVVSTPPLFRSKGNDAKIITTVAPTYLKTPILVPSPTQTQTQCESASVVSSHLSTPVVSSPPLFGSKGNDAKIVTTVSHAYLADQTKRVEPNMQQKSQLPEDAYKKAEEAKQQAEDAATLAAAAVHHCQTVWEQLDKQKNSGLMPEVEAKLASAAVAVAAAASVAKAAAAAAQVASNAAFQAKMMADEAWISSRTDNLAFSNAAFLGNSAGLATSSSIFRGGDESNSSGSILIAAKEASRKRVEAASFASKRAENMDAIVKAAELAAAAVSQAGSLVAMGDPPPLAKLVEAGPEGYWRVPQVHPEQGNEERSKVDSIKEVPNVSGGHVNEEPSRKKAKTTIRGLPSLSREGLKDSMDDHLRADGVSSFLTSSKKDTRGLRGSGVSDLDKTTGVVPESERGSRSASVTSQEDYKKGVGTLKETGIMEGCLVEVNKEGNGYKEAWFSANVLSLKNGKAFVSYGGNKSDDGSRQLKEWVALEADGNSAPRIRIARPLIAVQFEGTKKRRRAARGEYVWSVGDRVDVWIQDCWREGVISEKNNNDDSTLTVHFPAEGETSVVRAWHLRPTLIWKDGEWIECSNSRQRDPSHKGDTPQVKRLKLGGPAIDGREKDNISGSSQLLEPGKQELQLLPLSANEKIFNVGDNAKDDNKLDAPRTVRSGLQKEGFRVVFGVPKPGKKKKFMEVSKHYVAESSNKTDESNAKYLMPKGSGSRGWKNTRSNAKDKQAAELKSKVPKSGKPLSSFGRSLPQKDKFLSSVTARDHVSKDSVSTDGNESEQQNSMQFGSVLNTHGAAEGSFVFSSTTMSRKMFTTNAKSELVKKGNLAPVTGRSAKSEVKDNVDSGDLIPEVVEPRRSNRRIQPTSRLLEGLQSSLIIPKLPSFSHDKSHRSQSKGTFKGK